MTAMEGEETTPGPASEPTPVPDPAPQPDASPFLGKTIAPKPTVALNSDAASSPDSPPPQISPAPSRPPSAPNAKDALFGGNIVEETSTRSRLPDINRPDPRTLRESGLVPRAPQAAKAAKNVPPAAPGSPPRLRTYAADMLAEIRKRGETLSTIVGAEQNKKLTDQTETRPGADPKEIQRFVMLAGAGILVLAGVAIVGAVFLFMPKGDAPPPYTPLLSPNASTEVTVAPESELASLLAAERKSTQMSLGSVSEVRLLKDGAFMSAEEVLAIFGAPPVLVRNADSLMIGLHAYDRNQPFILVKISAYDLAFQAMLEWEKTIGEGLGAFFAPHDSGSAAVPALSFTDAVYANVDVRESQPNWRVLYAFPQRDLLVITTNQSTLREVLIRLSLSAGR